MPRSTRAQPDGSRRKRPPRYDVFAGEVTAALATLLPGVEPPLCFNDLLDVSDEASLLALLLRRGYSAPEGAAAKGEFELLFHLLKQVASWHTAQWMKARGWDHGWDSYVMGWL